MFNPEKLGSRYKPEANPETEEVAEKERKELELIENTSGQSGKNRQKFIMK